VFIKENLLSLVYMAAFKIASVKWRQSKHVNIIFHVTKKVLQTDRKEDELLPCYPK
jgi:hypothetical protein